MGCTGKGSLERWPWRGQESVSKLLHSLSWGWGAEGGGCCEAGVGWVSCRRPQLPRLCPQGWASRARRAGGGRQRRARAARRGRAAGGAVSGEGPGAGPGEERAPGGAQRRVPSRRCRPAAPSRTMATDSKCAWPCRPRVGGRGPQRWEVLLFGHLSLCRARGPASGVPRAPGRALGPLPTTLRYQAGLQRRRWSWQPTREGCGRRACAARRWRGRCDAVGQRGRGAEGPALAVVWGQCPQAQGQASGSPWRCEFKVPLEFWAGFADLPLGIRFLDLLGCPVAPLGPRY